MAKLKGKDFPMPEANMSDAEEVNLDELGAQGDEAPADEAMDFAEYSDEELLSAVDEARSRGLLEEGGKDEESPEDQTEDADELDLEL